MQNYSCKCFHEMTALAEHKHLKRSTQYGFSMSASMQFVSGNRTLQYLSTHLPRNKPRRVGHPCSGLYNKAFILAFTAVLHTATL